MCICEREGGRDGGKGRGGERERDNPSMPGFSGKYTFLKPSFLAEEAVVSPIHTTALSHCRDSGIKLTQAL